MRYFPSFPLGFLFLVRFGYYFSLYFRLLLALGNAPWALNRKAKKIKRANHAAVRSRKEEAQGPRQSEKGRAEEQGPHEVCPEIRALAEMMGNTA